MRIKKFSSLLMATAMCFSVSFSVFASDSAADYSRGFEKAIVLEELLGMATTTETRMLVPSLLSESTALESVAAYVEGEQLEVQSKNREIAKVLATETGVSVPSLFSDSKVLENVAVYVEGEQLEVQSKNRAAWNINWVLPANSTSIGMSRFSLDAGAKIYVDWSWAPSDSVSWGIYDNMNDSRIWLRISTLGPENGTITINTPGVYSIIVRNNSRNSVNFTGNFEI